jgi:hypothetical protein
MIWLLILPVILIWTIGFPVVTTYVLWKLKKGPKEKDLNSLDNVIKYGLFYIGLTDKSFYWEIAVNNLKKVAVVAVTVSLNNQNVMQMLLFIFFVLFAYHQGIK